MSYILLEYECPNHGRFESFQARSDQAASLLCPSCHARSERAISAPKVGTVWGYAATKAKSNDPHPNPVVLNTQPLADGMKLSEWKKQRREFRAEERRREIKKELG